MYDHCSAIKTDLSSFKVTKELLTSCRGAYAKYKIDLEEKREEVVITDKSKKRKVIQEEIQEIKKRKEDTERCISSSDNDIAKYSLEAEKKNDWSLLMKANSFRQCREEKALNIETFQTAIKTRVQYKGSG